MAENKQIKHVMFLKIRYKDIQFYIEKRVNRDKRLYCMFIDLYSEKSILNINHGTSNAGENFYNGGKKR